ncbi:MAG: hypothetical protein U0807_13120 [Candidatus Binatia bacterium]
MLLVLPAGARAGGARCLAGWRVAGAASSGRLVCHDGDPRCDADGASDGACTIPVQLCLNVPGCAPGVVGAVDLVGSIAPAIRSAIDGLVLPAAGADICSTSAPVGLVRGKGPVTLRARVRDSTSTRIGHARVALRCAPPRRARPGRAVVVTTDFETGQLATVGVARPHAVAHPRVAIHSDAVVRTTGGRVVVVNRFLGDSIVVLDPRRGLAPRLECTTDPGSDPHDVVAVDAHKRMSRASTARALGRRSGRVLVRALPGVAPSTSAPGRAPTGCRRWTRWRWSAPGCS